MFVYLSVETVSRETAPKGEWSEVCTLARICLPGPLAVASCGQCWGRSLWEPGNQIVRDDGQYLSPGTSGVLHALARRQRSSRNYGGGSEHATDGSLQVNTSGVAA